MTEFLLKLNEFILVTCNKEGIAIFVFSCLGFFGVAGIFMVWALRSGQLKDLEISKYEMLGS